MEAGLGTTMSFVDIKTSPKFTLSHNMVPSGRSPHIIQAASAGAMRAFETKYSLLSLAAVSSYRILWFPFSRHHTYTARCFASMDPSLLAVLFSSILSTLFSCHSFLPECHLREVSRTEACWLLLLTASDGAAGDYDLSVGICSTTSLSCKYFRHLILELCSQVPSSRCSGIVAGALIIQSLGPIRRPFSLNDISIAYPFVEHELISDIMLIVVSTLVPVCTILLLGVFTVSGPWRAKLREMHTGIMSLIMSIGLATLVTSGFKLVSRPGS